MKQFNINIELLFQLRELVIKYLIFNLFILY